MAQNARFGLSLRVLAVLASDPDALHSSVAIAEQLGESAVMIRRAFLQLHSAGFIEQRKGPAGGAKLKLSAKQIGLGDIYAATAGDWLAVPEDAIASLTRRAQKDAIAAMNETTLAQVTKRLKNA